TSDQWQQRIAAYQAAVEYHRIALVDCAPLLLLRDVLTGSGQNRRMQYIFVDEMQDYSSPTSSLMAKSSSLKRSLQRLRRPYQQRCNQLTVS
ncbi:hypothetical protein WP50_30460, partial [Lactiplantibacillus plantarum]